MSDPDETYPQPDYTIAELKERAKEYLDQGLGNLDDFTAIEVMFLIKEIERLERLCATSS